MPDTGPVGKGNHVVQAGECINSIAHSKGLLPDSLWLAGENGDLRAERQRDILLPGDKVQIPEPVHKTESASTGAKHRFRRKGVPCWLRLKIYEFDEPRTGETFMLDVEGAKHEGKIEADGLIEVPVPPDARSATLFLGATGDEDPIELVLGELDPVKSVRGAQQRLNNLHFPCGPPDGLSGQFTKRAIRAFQVDQKLEETGELDAPTIAKLEQEHGC